MNNKEILNKIEETVNWIRLQDLNPAIECLIEIQQLIKSEKETKEEYIKRRGRINY